jgi:D-tyrosyl-tRNA(Tyr) deacylase
MSVLNVVECSRIRKLLSLKLWPQGTNEWRSSVQNIEGEILMVSQFTLFASLKKTRPSFHRAMNPTDSKQFYADTVEALRRAYKPELVKGSRTR